MQIFTDIYLNHRWSGESVSGPGSSLAATVVVRTIVSLIIKRWMVKSILDIGCGDLNWISKMNLEGISYTGVDTVTPLILANHQKFPQHKFLVSSLEYGTILPKVDLVICRDCMVHLSHTDALNVLSAIKTSRSTHCLLTTFPKTFVNNEIHTGEWNPYNLQSPPFNLPKPLRLFSEGTISKSGLYDDKSLGMWKCNEIAKTT